MKNEYSSLLSFLFHNDKEQLGGQFPCTNFDKTSFTSERVIRYFGGVLLCGSANGDWLAIEISDINTSVNSSHFMEAAMKNIGFWYSKYAVSD